MSFGWRSSALLLLALASAMASPRRAVAQAALPAFTRLVVVGCAEGNNERALLEQVRVELLSAGVMRVDTVQLYGQGEEQLELDVATLRIDFGPCQPVRDEIMLGVADRQTGRHITRVLTTSDIPEAALSRAIALTLVELLRSAWRSLSETPEDRVPTPVATPSTPSEQAVQGFLIEREASALVLRLRPRVDWLATSRIYAQTSSGDLASSVSYARSLGSRLRLNAGGTVAGGGGDYSNVRIFQSTGRLALAVCSELDRPTIEVGTTWDIGYGQLHGPGMGRHRGFVAIGVAQATMRALLARGLEALFSVQAGYVLSPLTLRTRLDDGPRRTLGIEGPVLGVSVGLAGIL